MQQRQVIAAVYSDQRQTLIRYARTISGASARAEDPSEVRYYQTINARQANNYSGDPRSVMFIIRAAY